MSFVQFYVGEKLLDCNESNLLYISNTSYNFDILARRNSDNISRDLSFIYREELLTISGSPVSNRK